MKIKLILLQILCLPAAMGIAQTDLYNNGILKLNSSSDILYITGNFTNDGSASLTNNGQLYVLRNLDNNEASMSAGSGTLFLSGGSAQSVSGAKTFNTYNLNTNNSSGITLNNDLSVSGAHTFTNGLIITSSTPNYLIYEAGSSYSGSTDTRHVKGWVKKIGSTNFTFPVGNGTYLRQAAVESISAASEFNAAYDQPTPNQYLLQYPLLSLDVYEYWQINKISGGNALVHLNWDNNKVTFPGYILTDIAVSYYDGSLWTDQGGTATGDVTTGDVTSNAVSSFGYFAIGSRSFPLPLKFLSFTAQQKDDHVLLKWITAEEINTNHFEIERSNDGANFETLFKMPTVDKLSVQEYLYKDYSIINQIAFYRIRCVDKDGRSKYSKVVAVYESSYLRKDIHVLNPVSGEIIIRCREKDDAPTAYVLYNSAGSAILKGWLQLKGGMDNTIRLSFKPAKGIYYLKLVRSKQEVVQKLVIN